MRAHEFILDEDWRKWLAGAGAAGLIATGSNINKTPEPKEPNPIVQKSADPQQLQQAEELLSKDLAQPLISAARKHNLKGEELAQFLAQCAHETANFSTLKEIGNQSSFKKYDIRYNPAKAKALGNVKPGDGGKYYGRGYLQLTGRENYRRAAKFFNLPLEKHPEMIEDPTLAANVAIWYWRHRVAPKVSNFKNTEQATKPINPSMRGLEDRKDNFLAINALFKHNKEK